MSKLNAEELRMLKTLLANNHAYLQHFYKGLDYARRAHARMFTRKL
jgi:hypothetical protein